MSARAEDDREGERGEALALVREALAGLKYGQVVITVHDGAIAQVERTEKLRPTRR